MNFRRMVEPDLPALVRWMSATHAQPWFATEPTTVEQARQRYADSLAGAGPNRMWIFEVDGRPIGFVQDYPVAAYDDYLVRVQDSEAVAFDYLIGEADFLAQGLGAIMVKTFCSDVLARDYPDAPRFVASPDVRNEVSIRTLEKCGFTQGLWIQPEAVDFPEVVCTASREVFDELSGCD